MRTGQPLSPEAAKHAKALDNYLSGSKIEHDTMLYRGIDPQNPQMKQFAADIQSGKLAPGSTLSDKGFSSTTLNGGIASENFSTGDGGVVFKIKAPKGTPGAYMNTAMDKYTGTRYESEFRDEREMLLPTNSQYKVNKITKNGNAYEVEMTYLGVGAGAGKSMTTSDRITERMKIEPTPLQEIDALKDDCVGEHMKEIQAAHPEWEHDQQIAVALSKCGESNKSEHVYFTAGAIKAIGSGKIGGYLAVWGNEAQKDSHGEFFTYDTDFALEYYPERPVLYHHALSNMEGLKIGTIRKLTPDDRGLYAEAELYINDPDPTIKQAALWAYKRVEQGKLGWSSGSVPHMVDIAPDGEIKKWPIVEGSLTPTPAEPYKRTLASVIKADISALEAELSEPPKEPRAKVAGSENLLSGDLKTEILKMYKTKVRIKMGNETLATKGVSALLAALEKAGVPPDQIIATIREMGDMDAVVEPDGDEAMMADEETPAEETPETEPATDDSNPMYGKSINPKEVAAQILAAMKTAPARQRLPGGSYDVPGARSNATIQMRSKYAGLSPEDMQYFSMMVKAYNTANAGDTPMLLDYKFYHEMVDKGQKKYTKGDLDLTYEAGNRLLAIKSNELDNTATANQVAEWIPTLWNSDLWRRVRVDNNIARQFRSIEMPSATYELPVEYSDPTVYKVPETTNAAQLSLASGAAIPSSVVGSTKVELVSQKMALRVGFSAEVVEDSIIQFIPQLREQAMRSMLNAVDNVLVNGDTQTTINLNINLSDGTPTSTDKYLVFNGLRKLPLVTNTAMKLNANGATPTLQMIRNLRFLMRSTLNVYANRPEDLVIFVDVPTYGKLLNIDELLVYMNNGVGSTVNNGTVPTIDGIEVYPSAELNLTDANGYLDAAVDGTYGQLILAAKPAWYIGYRRNVTSSVDFLPYYDSYQLTVTMRLAFINKDTVAAAELYGIGLS